jgi:hypothetical protein
LVPVDVPLYPQKQTFVSAIGMSALCHKQTLSNISTMPASPPKQTLVEARWGAVQHPLSQKAGARTIAADTPRTTLERSVGLLNGNDKNWGAALKYSYRHGLTGWFAITARVAWSGPKSPALSMARRSNNRARARCTRLLRVPAAQPHRAAASS